MSKNTIELKSAIQNLNIKKPYDLRALLKPTLKAPAQIQEAQIEQPEVQGAQKKEPAQGFFMLAHSVFDEEVVRNLSGDVAEALEERKMIWKKFYEAFPSEDDQIGEIQKRLEGFPFVATQSFAKEMAVMKWWEDGSEQS